MAMNNKGYKLDLAHQTLTMTAAFADAANDPTSAEYKLVRQFLADFPSLKIVKRTHATPTLYNNKDGSKTKRNQFKNLTYKNMEAFIGSVSNSDKYMDAYKTIRAKADIMCHNPYAIVRKWFVEQFPKYRTDPLFYIDNEPELVDFSVFKAAKEIEDGGVKKDVSSF